MEKLKEKLNQHKKITIGITSFLSILLVIYFGMSAYFINHFYFGSEINGINVSGKSVEKVNELMAEKLQAYTLNLKERGGKNEQIRADEIGLKYNTGGDFRIFKDRQKPFKWISAILNPDEYKMMEGVDYDKELLAQRIDKLDCFDIRNIVEPENAGFEYSKGSYVIVDEVQGNKVDKNILYKHVSDAILNEETTLDLEGIDCYIKPQYTSKSQKIIDVKDTLNKYVSSKITYNFGERKEILDASIINMWLSVDENYVITFDEKKVREYVDTLSNNYNTVGKKRNFNTTSGKIISIGGGDYGFIINKDKETQAIISAVKEGQTLTKEPAYIQTALCQNSNDIGNTYVEINLSSQHLWFYKNGSLVVQGDIVSGNVSAGHTTPSGVYRLKYKQRNAILKGPDYEAAVSYWMPFNGGIGIHDASWRSRFGGNIYRTNGSHGCINSPNYLAKTIFQNIDPGTPVVCYY
ncbi:L,D-transpeptidase/peptidoglycan binding protein [Clostridium sp. SYSU_GA19001]|uniref:L,D-transpeptidase family protein n=1 Tax=Clostridium caldaquaticum TaxID=2940653 RepID=UPI0020772E56|nr:peptidoglycan binding domain-containing protein [Clostridium caldaquaticum]MCM8710273.1 L,D-transpeptidase/peptidoglycan binding protein [Clostridium caldaquaticum]